MVQKSSPTWQHHSAQVKLVQLGRNLGNGGGEGVIIMPVVVVVMVCLISEQLSSELRAPVQETIIPKALETFYVALHGDWAVFFSNFLVMGEKD